MAGLGFRHASTLLGTAAASPELGPDVGFLGAMFNTAIALVDYIADEVAEPDLLFEILSREVVTGIFESQSQATELLAEQCYRVSDTRMQLLLALVVSCADTGSQLLNRSGNHEAWIRLGGLVARMLEGERMATVWNDLDGRRDSAILLRFLEAKAACPSLAMEEISRLAMKPAAIPSPAATSTSLGKIFWRVDDLVDLLRDSERGAANALLLQLADLVAQSGRTRPSDADIYDLVETTAKELVQLVDSHTPQSLELSHQASNSSEVDRHADELGVRGASMRDFAKFVIALWTGWGEDIVESPSRIKQQESTPSIANRASLLAATEFIIDQQRKGYPDALHHLRLPRRHGLVTSFETHSAILAQRAVALDSLLDGRDAGLPIPRTVLMAEAMVILRAKHREVRGGWNYIPKVPELPPDADDLGQVVQELFRLGGAALASTCDEAVRLALDAQEPGGGLNTWILDPSGHSPADQRILAYLPVMGGWGVHPEVVANFFYGLLLYDAKRYHQPAMRVAPYFERTQDEDGSWQSKWYAGKYYGTYKVVALLARLPTDGGATARAQSFVIKSQRSDGGWGERMSDCLSTAFAMLGLAATGLTTSHRTLQRGAEYLLSLQQADGGWPACTWIAFPSTDGAITYGSRTITTAACMKALLIR
jgi:hypothetical protein